MVSSVGRCLHTDANIIINLITPNDLIGMSVVNFANQHLSTRQEIMMRGRNVSKRLPDVVTDLYIESFFIQAGHTYYVQKFKLL